MYFNNFRLLTKIINNHDEIEPFLGGYRRKREINNVGKGLMYAYLSEREKIHYKKDLRHLKICNE